MVKADESYIRLVQRLEIHMAGLGQTPQEIAETLKRRGVRGFRAESMSCPISHEFERVFGDEIYHVETQSGRLSAVHRETGEAVTIRYSHKSVADFIFHMDRGDYPFLEWPWQRSARSVAEDVPDDCVTISVR